MKEQELKIEALKIESDGNIVGDSFICRNDERLEATLGVLFGIIEIYNINDFFVDGFLEAINDLKTEYYLPPYNPEKSPEKRFEDALARANRRIQTIINQSIEEVDLRQVSAVLGVAYGNKIFVSSLGKIRGLFNRRKKNLEVMILDILANNQNNQFKPSANEKIFSNLLSGEIGPNDSIIFINEELSGLIPQHELAEQTLEQSPKQLLGFISDKINSLKLPKNFYAVFLKPATAEIEDDQLTEKPAITAESKTIITASTIASNGRQNINQLNRPADSAPLSAQAKPTTRPDTQQSIDKLIRTQIKTERYLSPSTMPNWQKLFVVVWLWLKKNIPIAGKKIQTISISTYQFIKPKIIKASSSTTVFIKNKLSRQPQANSTHTSQSETLVAHSNNSIPTTNTDLDLDLDLNIDSENPANADFPIAPDPYLHPNQITDNEIETTTEATNFFNQTENESDLESQNPVNQVPDSTTETAETSKPKPELIASQRLSKIDVFINEKIVFFLGLKKLQQFAFVGGFILLIIFCQSIVIMGKNSELNYGGSAYDEVIKKIENQLNTAEAQNIFSDEKGALKTLEQAKELLAEIPDKRTTKKIKTELEQKINDTAYSIQKITFQESPEVSFDFGSALNEKDLNLIGLAYDKGFFWTYSQKNNQLIRLELSTGQIEKRDLSVNETQNMTQADSGLLVFQTASGYYKYDYEKAVLEKAPSANKALFIESNIKNNSHLITPSLASSTIDFSFAKNNYYFFLDKNNKRMIILDYQQELRRQWLSPVIGNASGLAIDSGEKTIYLLTGNQIIKAKLDF